MHSTTPKTFAQPYHLDIEAYKLYK